MEDHRAILPGCRHTTLADHMACRHALKWDAAETEQWDWQGQLPTAAQKLLCDQLWRLLAACVRTQQKQGTPTL